MQFDLRPYDRAGPLRFEMTFREVESLLGAPLRSGKSGTGERKAHYPDFTLVFDQTEKLAEIVFVSTAKLVVEGTDVFNSPKALDELRRIDSTTLELAGILFFPKLGLTLGGFHTPEEKTAAALAKGRIDRLLPRFKPFAPV